MTIAQYFENLTEENEIKARYKELAKKYHPDLGGCAETMKQVNAQYEKVLLGMFQKAGKSITEIDELLANDAALRERLNAVIMLEDLIIEICGCWIWLTGDTKKHKEVIKVSGYFLSKNKCAWYWRSEAKKCFNRKSLGLDEIRQRHGSINVQKREFAKIG